jgi:hypothetical protein
MAVNTVQLSRIITVPSHPGAREAAHREKRPAPLIISSGNRISWLGNSFPPPAPLL